MNIETDKQITPEVAKVLREQSGLTQRKFWESIGSNQTSGHWFEHGKRKIIPKPLRVLIFQRYVAGIDLDFSTPESARHAVAIGREISAKLEARRLESEAKAAQQLAKELMRQSKRVPT